MIDFNIVYANLSQVITALLVAGGGSAAICYALFKAFGEKWLDSKFNARLQSLKTEQDRTLRLIQSTIDREIHRAKKLYDKEFDSLSESWRLLVVAFDLAKSGFAEFFPPVDRLTNVELGRLLACTTMEEWEKAEIVQLDPQRRLLRYRKWALFEQSSRFHKARSEFRQHLEINSIFFPEGFKEKPGHRRTNVEVKHGIYATHS